MLMFSVLYKSKLQNSIFSGFNNYHQHILLTLTYLFLFIKIQICPNYKKTVISGYCQIFNRKCSPSIFFIYYTTCHKDVLVFGLMCMPILNF